LTAPRRTSNGSSAVSEVVVSLTPSRSATTGTTVALPLPLA
jgi:hypothetical protein